MAQRKSEPKPKTESAWDRVFGKPTDKKTPECQRAFDDVFGVWGDD